TPPGAGADLHPQGRERARRPDLRAAGDAGHRPARRGTATAARPRARSGRAGGTATPGAHLQRLRPGPGARARPGRGHGPRADHDVHLRLVAAGPLPGRVLGRQPGPGLLPGHPHRRPALAPHLAEHLTRIHDHLSGIPLQVEGRRRTTPKAVARLLASLEARLALVPLLERFADLRAEHAALDFADQVSLAARIARTVPQAGRLARRLHRVVLLDEFQDTSVAQLEMLTDLFGPGHAACAVGD